MLENVILHQDNVPSHTATSTKQAVDSLGFEPLPHAPYSPDLAPCDFHLFPKLKNELRGIHFETDTELLSAV